jgi:outer membrane protein insertion porin family
MRILSVAGFAALCLFFSFYPARAASEALRFASESAFLQQQIVEEVDIQGNRRLRDEDLLYYIKTRPGDVYDPAALERDLKELLSLNFFDKTATRVITTEGTRGGVIVIFEVREWPIIRDLQFKGTKALSESDILKEFREKRVGVAKEAIYDPVKAKNATRVLKELLAAKGYPNAKITVNEEQISATSIGLTFDIDQGNRSRIIEIEFTGNEHFKSGELKNAMEVVKETGLISRIKGYDILDMRRLQYDLQKNVRLYMWSKGYFQARVGEPEVVGLGVKRTDFIPLITLPLPLISSKDDALRIIIPVNEGRLYRIGKMEVSGNSIFSDEQILQFIGLKQGDIADGKRLQDAVYEQLSRLYGSQGFIEFEAEYEPEFHDSTTNPKEGTVDIKISIQEGKQYQLRRLEFSGNTFTRDRVLRREFLLNEGEIYNQRLLELSVVRLNQTGYFEPIDKDKDVTKRTDPEKGDVDVQVSVREKGRQQISFNGAAGGLAGNSFGLEYTTNNLAGRGEVLSFQLGLGNRVQSFQFSYQEPYFRDRPISVGFSVFLSRYKFFGEGTFLTQNQDLLNEILFDPFAQIRVDSSNLFTQNTYGATVFATAPLSELFFKKRPFSQFSRIGLTYQITSTSIKDPPVNESADPAARIPVIYAIPSIITSRITGTFVYDTRQPASNGIDTLKGSQLAASIGFAGLGGDVRTYSPNITWSQYIPVRRKRSKNAEVFAYRILAGTIGSWSITDKIKNANSLAYVGGVPIYERYYLGSENDIRGYTARAISPIAPFDTYVTTRNVSVASNSSGTPVAPSGFPPGSPILNEIAALGQLTGFSGSNPALFTRNYRFIGGDTQLLGNFEYRIPFSGFATLALFADVGGVFNIRKTGTQVLNTQFLPDEQFLGAGRLTALALINTPVLESLYGSILYYNNRVLTKSDFRNLFCGGNRFGCPVSLPPGIDQFFLRGEVQQNSLLRVDDSAFSKLGDFKSSVGVEFRVQVPVINVPFRLIYYYNPNARIGEFAEVPGIFFPGRRSGFRFTVGRTF